MYAYNYFQFRVPSAKSQTLRTTSRSPLSAPTAFAHKGGMHMDAVTKARPPMSFLNPSIRRQSANLFAFRGGGQKRYFKRINEIDSTITKDSPEARRIWKS
jgi:2-isopropylmalate synthase